ncbi:MAG TPA: amidohydrolase [Ktedonobacterales bacterium]|nr:amidohydrolase [Ktedonobacterales bacterium]
MDSAAAPTPTSSHDDLHTDITSRSATMVARRRHYHMHPELSFEEHETAASIAATLRDAGLEVTEGVGGMGVVGLLTGTAPGADTGRTLMVRADIDALPVEELNDVEYRSQTPGKMHACGHDAHVAIALTLAEVLAARRDQLAGRVKFAFQHAEERVGGADPMIEAGVMRNPDVDGVIGLHVWASGPVGDISLQTGAFMASADEIHLTVRGRGGHGAMPHQAIDPVVVAAQIIVALQTLVSRETDPLHTTVLTFGSIHGGTAFNIIADEVVLAATLRTYNQTDRENMQRRISEVASGVAAAMRATVEYRIGPGCRVAVNDAAMTDLIRRAAIATVGADHLPDGDNRISASDDMASFLAAAPGCYFFLGAGNAERGITAPHHSARFDIDEACLPIGVETMARAALEFLAPKQAGE